MSKDLRPDARAVRASQGQRGLQPCAHSLSDLAAWCLPIVPGALAGATLLIEVFVGSEIVGAILDRTNISPVDAAES